jgi:hypothetical protein
MRELLEHRNRHQIEGEAIGGLERANAALAEDHLLVALLEDVLRRHQQLLERRREAALEQDRAAAASDLGEQRVVLHVARADLDHVGILFNQVERFVIDGLGDDLHAKLLADFGHDA